MLSWFTRLTLVIDKYASTVANQFYDSTSINLIPTIQAQEKYYIIILNIFAEWIIPRQLTSTDLVCHTCWTRVRQAIPQFTGVDAGASTSSQSLLNEGSRLTGISPDGKRRCGRRWNALT